jgi:hypothetical protein
MSLIFPLIKRHPTVERLLETAYEVACDTLVDGYGLSDSGIKFLLRPMTEAIWERYVAGERDQDQLAHAAVVRALGRQVPISRRH